MCYITRVLSPMSRFGRRSLNRLFSHFFWFNLSVFRLASPPGGMRLPPEGEPCIYIPSRPVVIIFITVVKALVRWATGKLLANRLSKLPGKPYDILPPWNGQDIRINVSPTRGSIFGGSRSILKIFDMRVIRVI